MLGPVLFASRTIPFVALVLMAPVPHPKRIGDFLVRRAAADD
jgi:hypothetical protein